MGKQLTILIDPGHGGHDSGATAGAIREADINLMVGLLLGGLLTFKGADVHFTRCADRTIELHERVLVERPVQPDLFISLHCNSVTSPAPEGLEVFTSRGHTLADLAATQIFAALRAAFPTSRFRPDFSDNDPDKEANFYVLRETRCPAVLVEMGFISNPAELRWLMNHQNQHQIAEALCSGILEWSKGR